MALVEGLPNRMPTATVDADFELITPPGLRRSSSTSMSSWATIGSNLSSPSTPGTEYENSQPEYVSHEGEKVYPTSDLVLHRDEGCENYKPQSIAPTLLSLDRAQHILSSSPPESSKPDQNENSIYSQTSDFRQLQILGNHHDNVLKTGSNFSTRGYGEENRCRSNDPGEGEVTNYCTGKGFSSNFLGAPCDRRDSMLSSPSVSADTEDDRLFYEPRRFTFPFSSSPGNPNTSPSSAYAYAQDFVPSNADNNPRDAALAALQCVTTIPALPDYGDELSLSNDDASPSTSAPSRPSVSRYKIVRSSTDHASQRGKRRGPQKQSNVTRLPLVVSSSDKPHGCSMCHKRFKRQEHLKRHGRTHTGERPHPCQWCHKRFSRTDNLNQHKKTHTRAEGGRNEYIPNLRLAP